MNGETYVFPAERLSAFHAVDVAHGVVPSGHLPVVGFTLDYVHTTQVAETKWRRRAVQSGGGGRSAWADMSIYSGRRRGYWWRYPWKWHREYWVSIHRGYDMEIYAHSVKEIRPPMLPVECLCAKPRGELRHGEGDAEKAGDVLGKSWSEWWQGVSCTCSTRRCEHQRGNDGSSCPCRQVCLG